MIVYTAPITINKSTYEKQKRALGLMEIGNKHFNYLKIIAWCYNYLSTTIDSSQAIVVKIIQETIQRRQRGNVS